MLTIDEIKNVSFRKASFSGGYNVEDVDEFIDEVIASFEQLKKEKTNLVHKIDRLATRLEEYRADEETVRNALLTSQKMSDACIKEAKEKAGRIIRDAEEKAQALSVEANKMTAMEKDNYLSLQADAVALRNELIELYRTHIKAIDDLPTSVDLENSQKALDEKYPTEPVAEDEINYAPAEEVKTEPAQVVQPVQEVQPKVTEPADDTKVAVKRQSKFNHLKFGDNYDVSAE
jgi:cell division initiation protein